MIDHVFCFLNCTSNNATLNDGVLDLLKYGT